jgi:hypothetical protein
MSAAARSFSILESALPSSLGSRTSKKSSLTPSARPATCISLKKTSPTGWVGFRRTAILATFGTVSLSSSTHFPLNPSPTPSATPVMLPPGRARLLMMPYLAGRSRLQRRQGS